MMRVESFQIEMISTHTDTEKMALSVRFVIHSKSSFCIIAALACALMSRCARLSV